MRHVFVQERPFDVGSETAALAAACPEAGGLASFLGIVRSTPAAPITALTLEHYPAMTQAALERIATQAQTRFALLGCSVIHRVGTLVPGEPIVLVLTAAHHRSAALESCAFLIDWLKTDAPFWKKEHFVDGTEAWVAARDEDAKSAQRWR
jgi:molybdopterin synthase catalytic subunit